MTSPDYRAGDQTEATMEKITETARDAGRRAVNLTEDIADAIRERPYTALAVAGGLAFAVGALGSWGNSSGRTRGFSRCLASCRSCRTATA
jgi:hypothetical protein